MLISWLPFQQAMTYRVGLMGIDGLLETSTPSLHYNYTLLKIGPISDYSFEQEWK